MVLSHWCKLIDGLQVSPLEFYKCIEEAVDRRQVPGLWRRHVLWPEGGLLSAKRVYLRLTREKLLFDICAAQFGSGSFVSYRLVQPQVPWLLIAISVLFAGFVALLVLMFLLARATAGGQPGQVLSVWMGAGILLGMYLTLALIALGTAIIIDRLARAADEWLIRVPFLHRFYERITRRNTYYRIDMVLAFQAAVHAAVLEIVDKHVHTQNLRPLTDDERKPVLSRLLMR
jgi:hypothetical protein